MNCRSCGAEIGDKDRFCCKCGAKQSEELSQPVSEPAVDEVVDTAAAETAVESEITESSDVLESSAETVNASAETAEVSVDEPADVDAADVDAPEAAADDDVISVIDSVLQNEPVEDSAAVVDVSPEKTEEKLEELMNVLPSEPEPVVQPEPPVQEKVSELPPLKKADEPRVQPAPASNGYDKPSVSDYIGQDMNSAPLPPPPLAPEPYPGEFAEKNPEPPVKVGAFRLTGAAIVAFFALIIMISTNMLFCLKFGITGDLIAKRIKKMNPQTFFASEVGDGLRVSDRIYYETGFGEVAGDVVDEDHFCGIMAKTDALDFTADIAKKYVDFIMTGDGKEPTVSNNDLADFFIRNDGVFSSAMPVELQTADYNKLRSNMSKKGTADNFSISKWGDKIGFPLENTKYILSPVTLGIFVALLLVLLIWVAVIVDRRGRHLLGFYGSVFCWSGAISVIIGAGVSAGSSIAHVFTNWFMFYGFATVLLPFAMYALVIGAAEFFLGFIFRRIKRAMRIRQKRNAAVEKALTEVNV